MELKAIVMQEAEFILDFTNLQYILYSSFSPYLQVFVLE